ncbi:unnamed protein product [Paramecium sonneborni]|uniref:Uncharacterized protein n=1 Tax=Paramecium sonneborni TaxID=65129 RepID=A0A8S1R6V1_9CILI|nr:unnamed protein product [Paramecium sonneborni]
MFRNLRQQYQKDIDFHFLEQFNKSSINLRCQNQNLPLVIKNSCVRLKQHLNLNQLNYLNVIIKYYKRSRSSQTSLEGFLNKRDQQILLSLPFHSIKMHQIQVIMKLWRRYIFLVLFLLRYQKQRQEHQKLILQNRYLQLGTPKIHIDTTKKRRRNANSQFKLSTFAEYIDAQDKQESKTKRTDDEKVMKSPVYLSFKYNDVRTCRLLRFRNNSIRTSNPDSPFKINQKLDKKNKLPPLSQIDRRMQRVYSNFGK